MEIFLSLRHGEGPDGRWLQLACSLSVSLSLWLLCRPFLGTSVGLWLFRLSSEDDLASPTTPRYRRINELLCLGVWVGAWGNWWGGGILGVGGGWGAQYSQASDWTDNQRWLVCCSYSWTRSKRKKRRSRRTWRRRGQAVEKEEDEEEQEEQLTSSVTPRQDKHTCPLFLSPSQSRFSCKSLENWQLTHKECPFDLSRCDRSRAVVGFIRKKWKEKKLKL